MLFLFIEKHQAEFQLDYIQLSPEIIGESVRHVPFQKKKKRSRERKTDFVTNRCIDISASSIPSRWINFRRRGLSRIRTTTTR